MKTNDTSFPQETIAARAYRLWEEAGRPEGRDQDFWFHAEQELSAAKSASAAPSPTGQHSTPSRRRTRKQGPSAA